MSDIKFDVIDGEFVGILGSNGSGKTTLLKVMDGLLKDFKGASPSTGQTSRSFRPGRYTGKVGLIFQNPDDQLFAHRSRKTWPSAPSTWASPEADVQARVRKALADVDMADYVNKSIHSLSFGQKKRACIAGLLAMGHEILLLDEPTAGLDPMGEYKMMGLLTRLNRENRVTIVMATHSVDLVPLFSR